MRQIRPIVEELKLRYSRELAQRRMLERRRSMRPALADRPLTPDNSEPWLRKAPQTLAECLWISDQVALEIEKCRRNR